MAVTDSKYSKQSEASALDRIAEQKNFQAYQDAGYANRVQYLHGLADEYGVSWATVSALASVLGPTEDFDGLISELEDLAY